MFLYLVELCPPATPICGAIAGALGPSCRIYFALQETFRDLFGQREKARPSMNLYTTG